MIFSSVNEDGIPKWRLISENIKVNGQTVCVTRRLKPQLIGAMRSVQPKRAQKAVCRHFPELNIGSSKMFCKSDMSLCPCKSYEPLKVKILDCVPHTVWLKLQSERYYPLTGNDLNIEAHKEGLRTWDRLLNYFNSRKIDINDTFRIEFGKV